MNKNIAKVIHSTSDEMLMQQAIQALHLAQITDDYLFLVQKVSGNLYETVSIVFPDHLRMIYLLTNKRRRQVWNAVLAAKSTQRLLKKGGKKIVALRHALLTQRETELLESAYGPLPQSFKALLSRLGTVAKDYHVYSDLFELAKVCGTRLRKELLHETPLTAKTIHRLTLLPEKFRSLRFAKGFQDDEHLKLFIEFSKKFEEVDFLQKDTLRDQLSKAIHRKGDVSAVMRNIYVRLDFPSQAVPDCETLRFLSNGLALEEAAKKYNNCLATLVPSAVRGDTQFYEWTGRAHAVVALRKHCGHWAVNEIRLKENREPADTFISTIVAHFAKYQVGENMYLSQFVEKFLGSNAFDFEDDLHDQDFDFEYMLNAA